MYHITEQPVEKVFCRALWSSRILHIAFSNADPCSLKLSALGFSTGCEIIWYIHAQHTGDPV
jgi:hypothetical protein